MRQAIETKYLGPTNSRGSRVVASAQAGRLTLPWDDALDVTENHRRAALALAERYGWWATGWIGGGTRTGYVWVCAQ